MSIADRRNDMDLTELVEELQLAHPEHYAGFEARHRSALEAVFADELDAADDDELSDLREDLIELLAV